MSPVPQQPTATTPSASRSSSTSTVSTPSSSPPSSPFSSLTSWDTRVGNPVYSSWGPPTITNTSGPSHSSDGLFSSKAGVAGLCAGVAVICLLIAGFLVYRIKYRQSNKSETPSLKPETGPISSGARPIKVTLPTVFRFRARIRHPFRNPTNSNASRSLCPAHLSEVPLTEQAGQPGQAAEFPLLKYQHTNSSVSAYNNSLQCLYARDFVEGSANPSLNDFTPGSSGPLRTLERTPSTGTISQNSNLDFGSQVATTFTSSPQTLQPVQPARRPLPAPPHPPPSYEASSSTTPGPLSPLRALASHARNLALLETDPNGSKQSFGSFRPAMSPPVVSMSGVQINEPPRIEYAYTISLATGERLSCPPQASSGVNIGPTSSFTPTAREGSAEQRPQPSLSMMVPDSPVMCIEGDPFSNARYELPTWLATDPFPGRTLRRSASQPSLYGNPPRSAAASSRVLPSDSSIRTLTPEPTSSAPVEQEFASSAPVLPSRPLSTVTSVLVRGPTEGEGPAVEDVVVQNGAERPGWAKVGNPLVTSRSLQIISLDRFEANESHPRRNQSQLVSSLIIGDNANGGGTQKSTFPSLASTPLSGAMPGPGLSRAFTIDSPRRPTPAHPQPCGAITRGRSLGLGSPSIRGELSSNFSSSVRTIGLSGYENVARELAPRSSASSTQVGDGKRKRESLVAPSHALPGDIGSIRSITPELGWIPTGKVWDLCGSDEANLQKESIKDSSEAREEGRASRLSLNEDVVLWGRLTSAMDSQELQPSQSASR